MAGADAGMVQEAPLASVGEVRMTATSKLSFALVAAALAAGGTVPALSQTALSVQTCELGDLKVESGAARMAGTARADHERAGAAHEAGQRLAAAAHQRGLPC